MTTKTYSPKDVNIAMGGVNIDGWESFTIQREAPNTTEQVSADGAFVGITYSANKTGMAELTVQQQNSPANFFLAAVQAEQDKLGKPLHYTIVVEDKSGGVICNLNESFLKTPANMDLAAEQTDRTWGFFVPAMDYYPDILGTDSPEAIVAAAALQTIKDLQK